MPAHDHPFRHTIRGRVIPLFDVRRLGRYAVHLTMDGQLLEFDEGGFWSTNLLKDERVRLPLQDGPGLPAGPCYHHTLRDCGVCRAG